MTPALTNFEKVREFHRAFNLPQGYKPGLVSKELAKLRVDLIEEELQELKDAIEAGDLVEIADALGDILYVTYGTADVYAIPADRVVDAIHHSNMTKLDENGDPILREDGKILKGPFYVTPTAAITKLLDEPEGQRMLPGYI